MTRNDRFAKSREGARGSRTSLSPGIAEAGGSETNLRGRDRKAARFGLSDRTLRLRDAVELLDRLITRRAEPVPIVVATKVHALVRSDAIFATLRIDYSEFDDWFSRAARAHRDAWYIIDSADACAAVVIGKFSDARPPERHLKLCCFKIAESAQGKKYGELMLRQVLEHCYANEVARCYITVLPKYAALIALLEQFGFQQQPEQTEVGESVYAKQMVPRNEGLDPLTFHVAFGPRHVVCDVPTYIVPILPNIDCLRR